MDEAYHSNLANILECWGEYIESHHGQYKPVNVTAIHETVFMDIEIRIIHLLCVTKCHASFDLFQPFKNAKIVF